MSDKKPFDASTATYDEIMNQYEKHGSERKASAVLGIPRTSLQYHKARAWKDRWQAKKMAKARCIEPTDKTQVFILSAAQDLSKVHEPFLRNLEAYAEHRDAEIMIAGYTYSKRLFEDHAKDAAGVSYEESVLPYLITGRIMFGDRLMFCGELNVLPTAVNPLSDLQTYTASCWGIVPHAKVHLQSIPTGKESPVKIMQTTGAVTVPNYIQKKAGQKAEFFHEVAAVVVELLPDGRFFVRHLLSEDDGTFQDLTTYVADGEVHVNQPVDSITWGDVHREKKDVVINAACWGVDAEPTCKVMMDTLNPSTSFIHDIIDFKPRNHHNIKDPHFNFEMHVNGEEVVEDTIQDAADFLASTMREGCATVVVESNHDLALVRWLKNSDYRYDPVNARYFLQLQLAVYEAIENKDTGFQILSHTMCQMNENLYTVEFLQEDESYIIANGIECGMHGHLGANGARGNAMQFSRMGKRSNTAHTHSATVRDGAWVAGVSGSLDMGYNSGLSSWSHSHIITHASGKRQMVTQHEDGLWCADAIL